MCYTIPCDMVRSSESMVTLNCSTYVFLRMLASGLKPPPHTRCDLNIYVAGLRLRYGMERMVRTVVGSGIRAGGAEWSTHWATHTCCRLLEEGRDAMALPGSSPRATCFMANGKLILRGLLCHYIMYLNRELYET